MLETLEAVATELDQRQLAEQLLAQAKEQGVELVGPIGLLNQLTKNVLESALDAEMAEHLGYDKHDPVGCGSGNSRNGTRAKTVLTEIGPVEIEVPRDTNSSFEPQIVKKRQPGSASIHRWVVAGPATWAADLDWRCGARGICWSAQLSFCSRLGLSAVVRQVRRAAAGGVVCYQ